MDSSFIIWWKEMVTEVGAYDKQKVSNSSDRNICCSMMEECCNCPIGKSLQKYTHRKALCNMLSPVWFHLVGKSYFCSIHGTQHAHEWVFLFELCIVASKMIINSFLFQSIEYFPCIFHRIHFFMSTAMTQ